MKFEYEKKDDDDRECVAFIDADGDLILRVDRTKSLWFDSRGGRAYEFGKFNDQAATHRFYRGDSITITF